MEKPAIKNKADKTPHGEPGPTYAELAERMESEMQSIAKDRAAAYESRNQAAQIYNSLPEDSPLKARAKDAVRKFDEVIKEYDEVSKNIGELKREAYEAAKFENIS